MPPVRPSGRVRLRIALPVLTELCGDATYEALNALMLLAALAALSIKDWRTRAALAGLAIGAACTVKQTAAIEAIAIFFMLNHDMKTWGERTKASPPPSPRRRRRRCSASSITLRSARLKLS